MKKQLVCLALGASVILLSGCSKKLQQFSSDYFRTTPTPLETVGETVPATVNGSIPAKFMLKNAKVTATPYLQYEVNGIQNQTLATPVVFQGENVRDNGQVVYYDRGGNVVIPVNVVYSPAMEKSDLYLAFSVDQNGNVYELPPVKVGYGIIATSTLANAATVAPAIAPDDFQKVISETYTADIRFLVNQANIRANQVDAPDYVDLSKQLQEAAKAPNREIAGINISSYASPEGSLAFNTALAERREQNTQTYLENQMRRDKITEFGELTSSFTPEDWEGFEQLVAKSNIQDKDLILGVLKMYPDPVQREQELRNMASVFSELADQILPQLRYSRIQATINVIGKSNSELMDLYKNNPSALTNNELLYVATLMNNNADKAAVYKKATELFPNDFRGYNNLGAMDYAAGNYRDAKSNFEKALRLDSRCREAEMNLGLISLLQGDYKEANAQIGAAAGLPAAADALGVYYLTQGEVANAANAFGNARTNNSALAQILSKDYSGARQTLAAITNPDATTYYLMAVLGARMGNDNMVMSNLREAVRLNPDFAKRAKNDLEFAKYNLSGI